MPYPDAKAWVQKQGRLTIRKFKGLHAKGLLHSEIPTHPDLVYEAEWVDWGDFLGTGRQAKKKGASLCFEEARAWVRSQGIPGIEEFLRLADEGSLPVNMPHDLYNAWPLEWKGGPDFFGRLSDPDYRGPRPFRPFEEVVAWARENCIGSKEAWRALSSAKLLPSDIPATPNQVYCDAWTGWTTFFGNPRKGDSSLVERILAYELSKFAPLSEHVKELLLTDGRKKRPDIILRDHKVIVEYDGAYWHKDSFNKDSSAGALLREEGWVVVRVREAPLNLTSNWDVVVHPTDSFHQKAVVLLRHLVEIKVLGEDLISKVEQYARNGRLFATPDSVFASVGWRKFEQAREFARTLGLTNENSWRKHWDHPDNLLPCDVPKVPSSVYRLQWQGYPDFLGADVIKYMTIDAAIACAKELGIVRYDEWRQKFKEGLLPLNAPGKPREFYEKDGQWPGTKKFFGVLVHRRKRCRTYLEAKVWAQDQVGMSSNEWSRLSSAHLLPLDLPSNPNLYYEEFWEGWPIFLGTGPL